MANWKRNGVQLCAPLLLECELVSVMQRAVAAGWLYTEDAVAAMRSIQALNIQCIPPTLELHTRALRWAARLEHTKAYDAHYLALAEELRAELWVADKRLAGQARQHGANWVRRIGGAAA